MRAINVYALKRIDQDASAEGLRARWYSEPLRSLRDELIAAFDSGENVLDRFPVINIQVVNGGMQEFADLRGVNLSGQRIGEYDLSQCCFDFALFYGANFRQTSLQYSSFSRAIFDGAVWDRVQATPISAESASFSYASITSTFIRQSNLSGAHFSQARLDKVSFVSSDLVDVHLERAALVVDSDIYRARISAALIKSQWLQEQIKAKNLLGDPVEVGAIEEAYGPTEVDLEKSLRPLREWEESYRMSAVKMKVDLARLERLKIFSMGMYKVDDKEEIRKATRFVSS